VQLGSFFTDKEKKLRKIKGGEVRSANRACDQQRWVATVPRSHTKQR
jgi:hypothetical protein